MDLCLLLLLLTLGGISSASLNTEDDNTTVHDKSLPQQNLDKNLQSEHISKTNILGKYDTKWRHSKGLEKQTKRSQLHDDKNDLFNILHEGNPTQLQNEYSSVKKSTNEDLMEEEEERINNIKLYTLLLIPWIIYPASKASYFSILELFNAYGSSKGVPAESAFLFQVIAQCVDFVALTRGRFKFIEGGMNNLQQEMLDYFLSKAGVPDPHKLAVQIFLPVSDWPEYEQKRK